MEGVHQLGATAPPHFNLEMVDEKFVEVGLLKAREKTVEVLHVIRSQFKIGQNENDARILAQKIFADYGATKHWHRPLIRFGEGTVLSFNEPISDHKLTENSVYHMDLGPVWPGQKLGIDSNLEYEGDYGDTFVFGQNGNAQDMINIVHRVFDKAKQMWRENLFTGEEIYRFSRELFKKTDYEFVEKVEGHRVADFPHHKYSKERLANIKFVPKRSLWVLELMVRHPQLKFGAFYEDLL